MEDVEVEFTRVNSTRVVRCKGNTGEPTMFYESDRSKSQFTIECRPDGTFSPVEFWPTCVPGDV